MDFGMRIDEKWREMESPTAEVIDESGMQILTSSFQMGASQGKHDRSSTCRTTGRSALEFTSSLLQKPQMASHGAAW